MVAQDKIILQGMKFYGYHGVLPEEKNLGQWFEV
ncbi:MAG: dihydroneopterin aldolase, partial [Peptococcia bacterium]